MSVDIQKARELIGRCISHRDSGKVEAVLRSEFQSALRVIFPDNEDETWINHYVKGTEALTKIAKEGGLTANRFIDNLVGSTTIEYESDLRNLFKQQTGFGQVRDHVAGLIRSGISAQQVRGILSDTIEWYTYDAKLKADVDPKAAKSADVELVLVDQLVLVDDDEASATRLVQFVRKHLAREQSRPLFAEYLASDLGLTSSTYKRSTTPLKTLVVDGRAKDSSIDVATNLWSRFVDHFERNTGAFRTDAYVDEAYVGILARLLSANVLEGRAISSDDDQLKAILNGAYFRDQYELQNMVEQDYFGWLVQPSYIDKAAPIAREIQRDLYAYDFSRIDEKDLFGRLMAQLARTSERKLLGQEWTPAWLAALVADRCLENLSQGEQPRIIDMCCGSGSLVAETLRSAKAKCGLSGLTALRDVITGIDIDPLAVMLSKTTWVITLADEIKSFNGPITIPIYHADSLFAVTPTSATVPLLGEDDPISISLDGTLIQLPSAIVRPQYRELFDAIVDWAYDEALEAKKTGKVPALTSEAVQTFLAGSPEVAKVGFPAELQAPISDAIAALINRMGELAVNNRNGIWAFILRNTYRPGLLSGQFNGLVSNPPWLTLSGLGDNPYKQSLTSRARLYDIVPPGSSFLHLELGTAHLIHAVDRYLTVGASIACIVPGTIFNGSHHEKLRQRAFLASKRPVPFEINEAWQVTRGTFKYPGAVLVGRKRASVSKLEDAPIKGFLAEPAGLQQVDFSVRSIGTQRTAWVLEKGGLPVAAAIDEVMPTQGADIMPRTAVCVDILDKSEKEWRVDTPQKTSPWYFTVKDAKELKQSRFQGRVGKSFVYRLAQSVNLLPFSLGADCAPIAIPAQRDKSGVWQVLDTKDIRAAGLLRTARRFQQINDALTQVGQGKSLQIRIDERKKLTKQVFGKEGFLVLSGAGGKNICAACIPVKEAKNLIIDQTLYWQVFENEHEAWYRVGMMNSHALTEAITPFNPKGDFSERHVHTLPYRLMPTFDSSNEDHIRIAELSQELAATVVAVIASDKYLADTARRLPSRRARLRKALATSAAFDEIEALCAAALGTTALAETADEASDDGSDLED